MTLEPDATRQRSRKRDEGSGLGPWISDITPKWTTLVSLHGKNIGRASGLVVVICAVVAIAFNYAENLPYHFGIDLNSVKRLFPIELLIIYIISLPYAIGSIILELCCPEEIRKYKKATDYLLHFRETNQDDGKMAAETAAELHAVMKAAIGIYGDKIDALLAEVANGVANETSSAAGSWREQNKSHPLARILTSFLFFSSIGLSLLVAAWTTPRHVFHVRSFADVASYFLGN